MQVRSYLISHGLVTPDQTPSHSGEFCLTCIECGREKKFYINSITGAFSCKVCHFEGSFRTFRRRFDPPTPQEQALEKFVSHSSELLFSDKSDVLGYLISRGFTEEFVRELRLGVCLSKHMYTPTEVDTELKLFNNDHWHLKDRIIIPYLDAGSVITVRGRLLPGIKDDRPKYLSLPGSKTELYIPREIDKSKPVTVTEAELDAAILAQYGEQSIGLPGSGNGDQVAERIREYSQIYLCFDPDEAGIRGADKLISHLPEARRIDLPEGYDANEYIKSFGYDSYLKLKTSAILYEDGKPQPNDSFGHIVDEYANWAWSNGTSLGPELSWAPRLQECLSGMAPGLYLLGATASSGKTRLLHKILYELSVEHPDKVVCVSLTLDDSLNRTVQMVHSLHSGISFNLLSTPKKLEGDLLQEYFESLDSLKQIDNLIIRDVKYGRSLRYIRKYLGSLRKKHRDKKIVVIIDSLASVSPEGQFDDDAEEYSVKSNFKAFLSRELSYLTRKYDLAIITTADLRKLQSLDARPTELDLKDAAELAYNADFTMFAYNDVKQNGNQAIMTWTDETGAILPVFELYIDKNRSTGKKELIRFKMDGDHCDFEECNEEEELFYNSLLLNQRVGNKS